MEEMLNGLPGLEVVATHVNDDGSFAILFDDGYILFAPMDNEVTFTSGRGWESVWESLTK